MKASFNLPANNFTRFLLLAFAFILFVISAFVCIFLLDHIHQDESSIAFLNLAVFSFMISTTLSWISIGLTGGIIFVVFSSVLIFLIGWATKSAGYLAYIGYQITLCFLLSYFDQKKKHEIIVNEVEIEKMINERNDLELAYKEKGTNISVSFEKFTGYYNLRKLANDFSTTLSLTELSQMVVGKTIELIGRGDSCFFFLADPETGNLSLVASKNLTNEKMVKAKAGDLFDFWIFRNRQSLIVIDTQKDFRFDVTKTVEVDDVRSVIAAPLIHEGKVIGTLRLNSAEPATFCTDDLRLLDAISTLASSAVSNAILFQKTEELAIRDSLTGLYVRRYFLERLAEEHRRSLITNAPLSLLMCDLDHFKKCNDRYGHGVGDFLLIKVAELFGKEAKHGIVARYGGEEFSILLPKFTMLEARTLAEAIRISISKMSLTVRREPIPITISIGVASIPEDTLDSEELIRIADKRLYQAKKTGRNKVC